MERFSWPKESEKWYIEACDMLKYPEIPLAKFFDQIIHPKDTVLDLGCGYGVVSTYLSPRCKKVIALDQSESAIEYLNKDIDNKGIKNIESICGLFSETQIEPCDVTIALYVHRLIDSIKDAKRLLSITKREGIILCNHPEGSASFRPSMAKRLGIEKKSGFCRNGCYIVALLESLGAKVSCEKITHDFGQPVDSLEEASKFMCWQMHLDSEYIPKIRGFADDYITLRDGRMYIENKRTSCVITFKK